MRIFNIGVLDEETQTTAVVGRIRVTEDQLTVDWDYPIPIDWDNEGEKGHNVARVKILLALLTGDIHLTEIAVH